MSAPTDIALDGRFGVDSLTVSEIVDGAVTVTTGSGHITTTGVGTVNGLRLEVVAAGDGAAVLAFSPAGP